jgi:hypothetical protein
MLSVKITIRNNNPYVKANCPGIFSVKIRTRFSFGAVEDPKWIVIGAAIFQAGFSPDGTRF